MNKNDATDALNDFLALAIDGLPPEAFELPDETAQAMLDAMPLSPLRDSLRDAFRENIDTDHKFF